MKPTQTALHHTGVSRLKQPIQIYAVNRYHRDKCWTCNEVVGRFKPIEIVKHNKRHGHYPWFLPQSRTGWYIAYNDFIDGDGTLTHTRDYDEQQAAQRGHNCDIPEKCDTNSICSAGNFNIEHPSEDQNDTLRGFLLDDEELDITFHRDLQKSRTCPGRNINQKYLNDLLKKGTPEEEEKAEQIKALQSKLDVLRKMVEALLKLFKNIK